MVCRPFSANGMTGFVCGPSQKAPRCKCGSGRPANLLCDWKTPRGKKPTCDAKICLDCSTRPATDKDLCPAHARAWREWKKTRKDAQP